MSNQKRYWLSTGESVVCLTHLYDLTSDDTPPTPWPLKPPADDKKENINVQFTYALVKQLILGFNIEFINKL